MELGLEGTLEGGVAGGDRLAEWARLVRPLLRPALNLESMVRRFCSREGSTPPPRDRVPSRSRELELHVLWRGSSRLAATPWSAVGQRRWWLVRFFF